MDYPLRPPRVGHIQFLNCLPLYHGLVKSHGLLDVELRKGTPTELNRMLLRGELDVSPISSVEYLRHHRDLMLLPDITVSSDGEVKSITLVSRVPLAELDGRALALTDTSATSHVLTRIILERRYGVCPNYFVSPPDVDRMLQRADAALLIGDPALRALGLGAQGLYVHDLGQEWKEYTGQTMVYAVWAVRRAFAARKPDMVREVYLNFQRSLSYSLSKVDEIALASARWEPFSAAELAAYFRGLRFEFGTRYQAGLLEFARQAQGLGELQEVPPLEFVSLGCAIEEGKPDGA
ncbi:MAG: ABC transporter substrate-binding protein [Chloroflexota bacterium]|nr:MAG: ABC transporter substrate-binding protein [Chloroflexota bacterium]